MNRRARPYVMLAAFAVLPWSAIQAQDTGETFDLAAALSGAQEPTPPDAPTTPSPGVETEASGSVDVRVAEDLSSFDFQLSVTNGTGVTQAHLHCGRPGENGPIVVFLSDVSQQGQDVNGELAQGTRTNADIEASAQGCEELIGRPVRNIASLAGAAFAGLIYANVHTVDNPAGEVRGQLVPNGGDGAEETPVIIPADQSR